ncbi:MAG TPA: DEAD/DEAH box helicase [Jatrophihabitans sp.]|jgi:SNF2 family DNA or RNA helicase|uniref:DEAD/DEAH box helicase n=1 Tax=Jatrophihabitans sp. TaxID=1932789 RepID=UPI002F0853BF
MSDTATLSASLAGSPPQFTLHRRAIVAEDWTEIALTVADAESHIDDDVIVLPPEKFFAAVPLLRGLLRQYNIAFRADDAVTALLRRHNDDRRSLNAALRRQGTAPAQVTHQDVRDAGVKRTLRQFQLRDLTRLYGLQHGANFSVPGAGKTTVTYALNTLEKAAGRVNRLLVVAPLSAFGAWEEDAHEVLAVAPTVGRYTDTGPLPEVVLVNYQRLARAMPRLSAWMAANHVHLVVDEAHRAKRGALGEWGRSLLQLAPLAARRDILTGTPAPNHPRDLKAILDILWPGGAATAALPADALRTDPPDSAMSQINHVIAPLYVRTTKHELDLPRVRVIPVPVEMGEMQQHIYDALRSRYSGLFDVDQRDAAMFSMLGEVTMYLLQAASSPKLLTASADPRAYRYPSLTIPQGSSLARVLNEYSDVEVPAKIARAARMIHAHAADERKTLLWSNFPANLLDLEQQLAALRPAVVYGAIPSAEDAEPGVRTREREIERFRHDPTCQVLLANPAALSEGVSLHDACHDAIYLERTFNAGQYLQSLDRIHRLGLEPGVETRIYILTSIGTIDERVGRRLAAKSQRLSRMLDDPALLRMSLPDEDDPGEPLDEALDLEEVLAHLGQEPAFNRALGGIPQRITGPGADGDPGLGSPD